MESGEAPPIRPLEQYAAIQRLPAAATPIEAGTFDVDASVVVSYEVRQ